MVLSNVDQVWDREAGGNKETKPKKHPQTQELWLIKGTV